MIALIPARGGSRRIPRKNLRLLGGHPLLSWTLIAAEDAGLPAYVSTDDTEIADLALLSGAKVIARPSEMAQDDSPDILWVCHVLMRVECDDFVILRPTSPFRDAKTIQWALGLWEIMGRDVDSARMVKQSPIHPGKMWRVVETTVGQRIVPFVPEQREDGTPWHSSPTQSLPPAYVQTGGMEIVHRRTVEETGTIAGTRILPLIVSGPAALDINDEADWKEAELELAGMMGRQAREAKGKA